MWLLWLSFVCLFKWSLLSSIKAFDDSIIFNLRWTGYLNEFIQDEDNSMLMTTAEKEQYLCYLPNDLTSEKSQTSDYHGPSAIDLLKPLFFQVACSYKLEQYWTYELCHGRHFRQYHEESTFQGIHVQEYLLGRFDLSKLDSPDLNDGKKNGKVPTIKVGEIDLPYLEINMTGGTMCDLNNKPRFTRVMYVCSVDVKQDLHSFKETSSCEYEAIVSTPILCEHPDFKIKVPIRNDIRCHALGDSAPKPKQLTLIEKEDLEYEDKVEDQMDIPNGLLSPPPPPPPPFSTIGSSSRGQKPHDPKLVDDFLSGAYCLQGGSGWWKYEFCFGKKVEQFHEDYSKKKTTLLLGVWDKIEHVAWLEKNPLKKPKAGTLPRYVSHYYGNGDICDSSQKRRSVEVKLKCKDNIEKMDTVSLYLLEPKICEYILMVESSFICPLVETVDENGIFDI